MMDRTPKPGEQYRHFKNKLYQIITVAKHSETDEEMVVYQALYGDFGTYVRPLPMFISRVDKEKYPDAAQEYRFELVQEERQAEAQADPARQSREAQPNEYLIRFLDADTYDEKMELLNQMMGNITQRETDSLFTVLDMPEIQGSVEEQIMAVKNYIAMQEKYNGKRLR